MRKALENMRLFKERRQRIGAQMKDAVMVVASTPEAIRNGNVEHPYRQDSNLYYLTGFEEPQSIFVFRPGQNPETILFVRQRDRDLETWNGFRFGPELAKTNFNMDATYRIEEFPQKIVELLGSASALYYRFFKNPSVDKMMESALLEHRHHGNLRRSGQGVLPIFDADELIGESRVIKNDLDLLNHRQACELSSEAHLELMRYVRPGMNEREVEGYFIYQIMKRGAARPGYNNIVAGGDNACTLHYVYNDQTLKDGDLLLIDAGGEYNYFTADITRTFPVNGKFTAAQAEIYQGILDVQKAVIEAVKPGVLFQDLQDLGSSLLADLILELGLLTGRKEDILAANLHRKYYPHGIGHYLGMDVHDAGIYRSRNLQYRPLEAGMVLTVEPGLYIPADDKTAAEKYRGIGIRIEDNILVTSSGYENLTQNCPKEIVDIEALMKK